MKNNVDLAFEVIGGDAPDAVLIKGDRTSAHQIVRPGSRSQNINILSAFAATEPRAEPVQSEQPHSRLCKFINYKFCFNLKPPLRAAPSRFLSEQL